MSNEDDNDRVNQIELETRAKYAQGPNQTSNKDELIE